MPVESSGIRIFCIDNDSSYRQSLTGMCYFLTCVSQQYRPQAFPLIAGGYSKSPDQSDRYWIFRKLLGKGLR